MSLFNRNQGVRPTCEEVIELYSDMVYKVALSTMKNESDAQDIYQEVFLRYVKYNTSFESLEHVKAWFIRVTLNCCKSVFTSKKRKENIPLEVDIPVENKADSGIRYLVAELEEAYRIVIHLFYYEELSIKEISSILGDSESAVKTRLSRARVMLKEKWEETYV